jgi:hypothetical protein
MRVRFEIEDRVSPRLEQAAARELSEARRRMVEDAMRAALSETIQRNPVETGRSRAAWGAALRQLGSEVPADWGGASPNGAAIAEGAARCSLERNDHESTTTVSASNGVRYVGFLEYGTRKMAPFAMVRRALLGVQQQVARWFEFPR